MLCIGMATSNVAIASKQANSWQFDRINHYGGQVFRFYDGVGYLGSAIECFNYYGKSIGFSVTIGGDYVGRVKTIEELP